MSKSSLSVDSSGSLNVRIIPPQVLEIKKLNGNAILPTRAHSDDAGADLYGLHAATVEPGEGFKFSTGIAANIPSGYYLHIHARSSMSKQGWVVLGGIVDCSYKGELFVMLRNVSNKPLRVEYHDRIAQLVLCPVATPQIVEVEDIGISVRGSNGFGSSGA